MSKKPTPPKPLKPTEKVGGYCEIEKKLMQIHVGKLFFTQYIIKLQNKRICTDCCRGQILLEIQERFEYSYNDEEITMIMVSVTANILPKYNVILSSFIGMIVCYSCSMQFFCL